MSTSDFRGTFGQASFGGQAAPARSAPAGQPAARAPEPVRDISTAEFMAEVIEASRERPVLVDFWAPWCGPCKQLGPVLEKVVRDSRGAVKLVKMNIDQHPQIAGQMGIQSIPAVVAFVDGRPKDAFMGAIPEGEVRRFIDKLAGPAGPSPIEEALAEAARLAAEGAPGEAANLYAAVLEQDTANLTALVGLGTLYLAGGALEQARGMLAAIPAELADKPDAVSFRAALELAEQAASLGDTADLVARIEADPKDHEARFDLAVALNAAGRREEAAENLLEIVRRDRKWRDDGARAQLLQFFEAWGPMDEATLAARRRLSSLLFS